MEKINVTCNFMMNVVATTSFLLPSDDLSRGYNCNYICWHHKNIGAFTFCFIAKSFLMSGGDKVSNKKVRRECEERDKEGGKC